ncbi:MAG: protein translocase subunit SecD [Ilumatobacteraceae bacterium]
MLVSLIGIVAVALIGLIATVATGGKPQLGLDLQGGASVTLRPVGAYDSAALDVVPDIYRSRIDSLGVAEPEIIRQGDTIVVNLPGVKDKERAIELIGVTGKVMFRPVLAQVPLSAPIDFTKIPTAPTTTIAADVVTDTTIPATDTTVAGTDTTIAGTTDTTVAGVDTTVVGTDTTVGAQGLANRPLTAAPDTTVAGSTDTTIPGTDTTIPGTDTTIPGTDTTIPGTDTTIAGSTDTTVAGGADPATQDPAEFITPAVDDLPENSVVLPLQSGLVLYQLGPAFALGETAINTASAGLQNGEWVVQLELKTGALGLDAWNDATAKCKNQTAECPDGGMAIVLDHQVVSAPVPQIEYFSDPTVVISGGPGGFEESEAQDLARILKYGGTPIEMRAEAAQTVSATLGKDSLRAGVISGAIGIALVLVLMLLYYRKLALVVFGGLLVSGGLLFSVISLLSRTKGLSLTLAGVTGIIVSVGVTVDSYVVFFERLKDELRNGRSFRSASIRGQKSAWRTIVSADTVSLLGASVLWYLSVGSVRGFAFFLGLSTLTDMVVAYFYTRPAILLLARTKGFAGNKILGVEMGEALAGGTA